MPSRYGLLAVLLAATPPLILRLQQVRGYRRFSGKRLLIPIILFATLLGFVLKASLGGENGAAPETSETSWVAAAPVTGVWLGMVVGIACAGFAVSRLVFEARPQGLFYRTAPWIPWVLLGLFAGRVAYRAYSWTASSHPPLGSNASYRISQVTDDGTLAFAAMLFSYHLVYCVAVLATGNRRLARMSSNAAVPTKPPAP
jgi:hypothetical protein